VPAYDLVGDIQSQPRPLPDFFGCKERLEDILHDSLCYARAIVFTFNDNHRSIRVVASPDNDSPQLTVHNLNGIAYDIQANLSQVGSIPPDLRKGFCVSLKDMNACTLMLIEEDFQRIFAHVI